MVCGEKLTLGRVSQKAEKLRGESREERRADLFSSTDKEKTQWTGIKQENTTTTSFCYKR